MVNPQVHWDAAAAAINERLPELRMTQQDLANAAGVSLTTVRDLIHNRGPRRRSPRTLAAISSALDWPAGKLDAIARGLEEPESTLEERVAKLEAEVAALRNRVDSGHSG